MSNLKTLGQIKLDLNSRATFFCNLTNIDLITDPTYESHGWRLCIPILPVPEFVERAVIAIQKLMIDHPEFEAPLFTEPHHKRITTLRVDPMTIEYKALLKHHPQKIRLDQRPDGFEIEILIHESGPYAKDAATWKRMLTALWKALTDVRTGFGYAANSDTHYESIDFVIGEQALISPFLLTAAPKKHPERGDSPFFKVIDKPGTCPLRGLTINVLDLIEAGISIKQTAQMLERRQRHESRRLKCFHDRLILEEASLEGIMTQRHPQARTSAVEIVSNLLFEHTKKSSVSDATNPMLAFKNAARATQRTDNLTINQAAFELLHANDACLTIPFSYEGLINFFTDHSFEGHLDDTIKTQEFKNSLGPRNLRNVKKRVEAYFEQPEQTHNNLKSSLVKHGLNHPLKLHLCFERNTTGVEKLIKRIPFRMQLLSRQLYFAWDAHKRSSLIAHNHITLYDFIQRCIFKMALEQSKRNTLGRLMGTKAAKVAAFGELHQRLTLYNDQAEFSTIFSKWFEDNKHVLKVERWHGESEAYKTAIQIEVLLN